VANGSLEHRILGALAEQPQPLQAIVAVAKARKGDVQRTVKAMVAAGQLKQTSGGRWRTYGLPA
jgi:DNA-binding IclR family transcriptional regulator